MTEYSSGSFHGARQEGRGRERREKKKERKKGQFESIVEQPEA
jgi:hypothetical protein